MSRRNRGTFATTVLTWIVGCEVQTIGHLPPKKLALVAVGGITAGLLWKRFGKKKSVGATPTSAATGGGTDTSQFALAGSSTGPYAGASGGTSTASPDVSGTRDVGGNGITLPVLSWIIKDKNGIEYRTDGSTITPLNPGVPVVGPTGGQTLGGQTHAAVQTSANTPGPNGYVPSVNDITLAQMDRNAQQYVTNAQAAAAASPDVFNPVNQGWVSQQGAPTQLYDPVQSQADATAFFHN